MKREYTAVIQKDGRWYIGWIEEVPGVNSQGRTLSELRRNLKEALQLIIEENRKISQENSPRNVRREPISIVA
jgi:predicted RNase H-like HicB family nuclease